MNNSTEHPLCPACRQGQLHPITHHKVFHPRGTEVSVTLLTSLCDACGVQTTRASQHEENLRRLADRKPHYGKVLMGEEIVALRKRYGLTQQAAAQVFGKGKIAFSRYENEVSYPDDSTTLLLQLALEKPDTLKWLADRAGVDLPLWCERNEDAHPPMPPNCAPRAGSALSEQGPKLQQGGRVPTLSTKQQDLHSPSRARVTDEFKAGLIS
jgi:putative zinc finger/helix-turn-helix YgiT family protein